MKRRVVPVSPAELLPCSWIRSECIPNKRSLKGRVGIRFSIGFRQWKEREMLSAVVKHGK